MYTKNVKKILIRVILYNKIFLNITLYRLREYTYQNNFGSFLSMISIIT